MDELEYLKELAADARGYSEEEWGTARQIDASNQFFTACKDFHPRLFAENSPFSEWALKATEEEAITEALRLAVLNQGDG